MDGCKPWKTNALEKETTKELRRRRCARVTARPTKATTAARARTRMAKDQNPKVKELAGNAEQLTITNATALKARKWKGPVFLAAWASWRPTPSWPTPTPPQWRAWIPRPGKGGKGKGKGAKGGKGKFGSSVQVNSDNGYVGEYYNGYNYDAHYLQFGCDLCMLEMMTTKN